MTSTVILSKELLFLEGNKPAETAPIALPRHEQQDHTPSPLGDEQDVELPPVWQPRELEEIMEQEGVDRNEALLIQQDEDARQREADWKAHQEAMEKARILKEEQDALAALEAEEEAKREATKLKNQGKAEASYKATMIVFWIALAFGTLCFAGFFLMGGL
jgi:hypothetical protein